MIVETLVEKLNIVWTFWSKDCEKQKHKIILNQGKKQHQSRSKKVKVYYIGIKDCVQLPET